ncbi:MAG: KEOPS complex subunit Pcc1 [Candidatus Micrarchaeia archaeon]
MKALLIIDVGKDAKNFIKIMDKSEEYKRSRTNINEKGGKISIEVESSDAVAMLASLNSVLKQLRVISGVANTIDSFH